MTVRVQYTAKAMRLPALLALILSTVVAHAAPPTVRPNIVLVIADDLGWPYAGFMGDPIVETPNLDSIAAQGVTFRFGQLSASVCRASLRTLLTGLEPARWLSKLDVIGDEEPIAQHQEVVHFNTIARELETAGYRTFQGGKYWEGTHTHGGFGAGTKTAIGQSIAEQSGGAEFGREGLGPLLDFLDQPSPAPFFVWFAPMLPHVPLDAGHEFRSRYENRGLTEDQVAYFANVTRLDSVVGSLQTALSDRNLSAQTLFVVLSDNGWEVDTQFTDPLYWLIGDPRGKGSIYELGFRTPVIFAWPGVTPIESRQELIAAEDVFQTILDFAGAVSPRDSLGESARPEIFSETAFGRELVIRESSKLRPMDWQPGNPISVFDRSFFVRDAVWRYVWYYDRGYSELFHIASDPYEDIDVLAANVTIATQYHSMIEQRIAAFGAPSGIYEFTGTVRTSNESVPVAAVAMRIKGRTERGDRVRTRVRTSASGFFRAPNLPAGAYRIRPKARGMRFRSFTGARVRKIDTRLPLETGSRHFELTAQSRRTSNAEAGYARITGSIRSQSGLPIAFAPISVRGITDRSIKLLVLSDENGEFVHEGLPAGDYVVRPLRGEFNSEPPLPAVVLNDERDSACIDFESM